MGKIKISELDKSTSLKGFYTIGTDSNNESVQVSLEFVGTEADRAKTNADAAATATTNANTATANAEAATAAAKTATANANTATTKANEATTKANTAAANADTATANANTATANAEAATTATEKVNATLSDDYTFAVTDRTGTEKSLSLASPADVADMRDSVAELKEKVPNVWANVLAIKDCAIKVDGQIVELTAHKNVIIKDFSTFAPYADKNNYYSPKWITRFDLHYNGLAQITRFYTYHVGLSKDYPDKSTETFMSAVPTLDVSCFDTSKMTTMFRMFDGMSSIQTLDTSGFDVSGLTDTPALDVIFRGCKSLKSIDTTFIERALLLEGNKFSIGQIFSRCSSLTALDVSGWNTQNVTSMEYAFYGCSSLTALDVSEWNTQNVTNMSSMFANCGNLTNLIFGPGWGTQTSTSSNALALDLSSCGSNKSYKMTDETWSSMLTMYDRATAGLTAMTIRIKSTANIPDGWEEQMAARGYTITKV